jgi:hypothetical protein
MMAPARYSIDLRPKHIKPENGFWVHKKHEKTRKIKPKNGGLTWINRITTDKYTTKPIKGDNQQGGLMYCSNYLFLFDFILSIHVQMLFIG